MYNIILIPYRSREKHLDYFIKNTVPLLKKHLENLKIIVIEQANDKLFNRGLLLNIGFKENLDYENALYFTHDVDVNPKEETIINYYKNNLPDTNTIKGIYTSRFGTLGGIICFLKEPFLKINGFPNNFWGWGVEDRVLQNRAEFHKLNIPKNILDQSRQASICFTIFEDCHTRIKPKDAKNKYHTEYRYYSGFTEEKKIEHNRNLGGIDNMIYTIIEKRNITEDIELIKVDI